MNRLGKSARLLLTGLLVASTWAGLSSAVHAYELDQHQWRDRLLVLVADDARDADLVAQQRRLAARTDAVADRRLRVFRLLADSGWIDDRALSADSVRSLRRILGIAPGQRELLLIGLDGGIKRRGDLSTDLDDVFAQIDAMPMRREELRSRAR